MAQMNILSFPGDVNTLELKSLATDCIPLHIDKFKMGKVQGASNKWKAELECSIKSFIDVQQFVEGYTEKTGETLKLKVKKEGSEKSGFVV